MTEPGTSSIPDTAAGQCADDKRVATLSAALALRGHGLYRLADGSFLAVWRGAWRELADVHAIEQFAQALDAIAH